MPIGKSTICYYNENAETVAARYESVDFSVQQKKLAGVMPRKGKILEIGSGSGRDAAFLLKNGYNVECVDGSEEMNAAALKAHPVLKGRIRRMVLPEGLYVLSSGEYAAVYSFAVLMHLENNDVMVTLEEVHRMLKKNGIFYFSIPLTRPNMSKSGFDLEGRYFLLESEDWWTTIVRTAGFECVSCELSDDSLGRNSIRWLTLLATT